MTKEMYIILEIETGFMDGIYCNYDGIDEITDIWQKRRPKLSHVPVKIMRDEHFYIRDCMYLPCIYYEQIRMAEASK